MLILNRTLEISFADIDKRIKKLPAGKFYGIPRGGQHCMNRLPVHQRAASPEEADHLLDDLIDSGTTRRKWLERYPEKQFFALYDKLTDTKLGDQWLKFPWEESGEQDAEENMRRVIQAFDDGNREGLVETPKRYIKFLNEFLSPPEFNFTTFDSEGHSQMIVQIDIPFYSLCEHHLAPFFGKAHIAYIPNKRIVGLSKLARTLETYSRRFQNQERITEQVAARLMEELDPLGVGVVLEAEHLCMAMRGVRKANTKTRTSALRGVFESEPEVRAEFLTLTR